MSVIPVKTLADAYSRLESRKKHIRIWIPD